MTFIFFKHITMKPPSVDHEEIQMDIVGGERDGVKSRHGGPARDLEIGALTSDDPNGLRFTVTDVPPVFQLILLGIQHFLTMLGSTVLIPLSVVPQLGGTLSDTAQVISTIFMVSGFNTLVQTTFGDRLPIVQGGSFSFLGPTFAIAARMRSAGADFETVMREIQGAIILCGITQCIIGFSGLGGLLLRFVSPLSIAPTIALVGLGLLSVPMADIIACPALGFFTILLLIICSQMLGFVRINLLGVDIRPFTLFPIIIAMIVAWVFSAAMPEVSWMSAPQCRPSTTYVTTVAAVAPPPPAPVATVTMVPAPDISGLVVGSPPPVESKPSRITPVVTEASAVGGSGGGAGGAGGANGGGSSGGGGLRQAPHSSAAPTTLPTPSDGAAVTSPAGTATGVVTDAKKVAVAETETVNVLKATPFFRWPPPHPFQWGFPTFSISTYGVLLGASVASMVESVGDYYAAARLSGAPPPPSAVISRGLGAEGVGGFLAGLFGTGNGTTSYSENIAALALTRVGSRVVVQVAACVMIFCGLFSWMGALMATIPHALRSGLFMTLFGLIAAVGLSNLQYCNMNSPRNLFVVGLSLFGALACQSGVNQYYAQTGHHPVETGVEALDNFVNAVATTPMLVGFIIAITLDLLTPASKADRGMLAWERLLKGEEIVVVPAGADPPTSPTTDGPVSFADADAQRARLERVYSLPWGLGRYTRWARWLDW